MFKNTIVGERGSGRTTALARLVAGEATVRSGQVIVVLTPFYESLRHQINLVSEALGDRVRHQVAVPQAKISMYNGTVIYFMTDITYRTSGRGRFASVIAVDDADLMDLENNSTWQALSPLAERIWTTECSK